MTTKAKKAARKYAGGTAETLVYCGPTIPHICSRFTMFNAVPDALNEKAEQLPLIRNLILPLAEFCEARQQIERRSGAYYSIYQQIQKSI